MTYITAMIFHYWGCFSWRSTLWERKVSWYYRGRKNVYLYYYRLIKIVNRLGPQWNTLTSVIDMKSQIFCLPSLCCCLFIYGICLSIRLDLYVCLHLSSFFLLVISPFGSLFIALETESYLNDKLSKRGADSSVKMPCVRWSCRFGLALEG